MHEIITKLTAGARQLSLNLNELQVKQIIDYLDLLQKWNQVFNLTAIPVEDWLSHHVLDSLAIGRFFTGGRYLDAGTGAGIPGVLLAILLPQSQFTLLDSNSKKTSFIRQALHVLNVRNAAVMTARLEIQPTTPLFDSLFDGIVSRAFTALQDFIKLTESLLKPGGAWYAMKGPRVKDELKDFQEGYQLEEIFVPFLDEERYLVRIVKTK